jgi:hypothetical protein
MLILLLIFAQVVIPKGDMMPVWVETPVPHYSCSEDARIVEIPGNKPGDKPIYKCGAANKFIRDIEGINYHSQEMIYWEWSKTVPKNGRLRISFPAEFVRQPGCEVTDTSDEKNLMRFSDQSKEGFTIHSKAGHELSLRCKGVINR